MNLAELIKDMMDSAKDRVKTPITGAFMITFILYNWRPIFFLMFSEASIEDKIVVINYEYCSIWKVINPLLIALIYTIGIPYLMFYLEKFTKKAVAGRKSHKGGLKLLDKELEYDLLLQEHKNAQAKSGNMEAAEINKEREDLKKQISDLLGQLEETRASHNIIVENYKSEIENKNKLLERYTPKVSDDLQVEIKSLNLNLTAEEKAAFINVYQDLDKKTFSELKYNSQTLQKLVRLGLLEYKNNRLKPSFIGVVFYRDVIGQV